MNEASIIRIERAAMPDFFVPNAAIDDGLSLAAVAVYAYACRHPRATIDAIAQHFGLPDDQAMAILHELHDWRESRPSPGVIAKPTQIEPAAPELICRPGYIYVIQAGPHYKIGLTKSIKDRMKMLAIQLPYTPEIIFSVAVDDMWDHEERLHKMFADKRMNGEWFNLTPTDIDTIRGLYAK